MEDDFDHQRAAYRAGMEAANEGDTIEANPFDQDAETAEWLAWRRGLDEGKRLANLAAGIRAGHY